jgi:hypothetical protein
MTVAVTVNTVKQVAGAPIRWTPPASLRWPLLLMVIWMGLLVTVVRLGRRSGIHAFGRFARFLPGPRLMILSVLIVIIALAGSCRSPGTTTQTLTGNYTITITGTLGSNTAVTRSTTVNLAIT